MSESGTIRRVVIVVWWLDRVGGMERHVTELACALRRTGVEVMVICQMPLRRPAPYARQLRREGVELLCAPAPLWIANGLRQALRRRSWQRPHCTGAIEELRRLTAGNWLDQWLVRVLVRECRTRRPDLLHIHGCRLAQTWVARWAQLKQLPAVYTEHVAITQFGGPLDAGGPDLALAASALTCVSQHARRDLLAILPEPRTVEVSAHIVREPDAAPPNREVVSPYFLCPARLEFHKGVDVLLRAFSSVALRHPQIRLVLAGDGPLSATLKTLARQLLIQDRVDFRGLLPPDAMLDTLLRATAVVLASRTEGLPLSILEAMACGKPIIATAVGGIPEVIRNGENGILVESENPANLAGALDRLLSDPALGKRLGNAALRSFREGPHQEHAVIAETLALYQRAASQKC